jgi:hypothetical protein
LLKYFNSHGKRTEITTEQFVEVLNECGLSCSANDRAKWWNGIKYDLRTHVWELYFTCESEFGRPGWLYLTYLPEWIALHERNDLMHGRTTFDRELLDLAYSYLKDPAKNNPILKNLHEDYITARNLMLAQERAVMMSKSRWLTALQQAIAKDPDL